MAGCRHESSAVSVTVSSLPPRYRLRWVASTHISSVSAVIHNTKTFYGASVTGTRHSFCARQRERAKSETGHCHPPFPGSHHPKDYCRTAHGAHSSIKKCCLQHLSCPIHIELGATKYGLENKQNYPLYYCKCEIKSVRVLWETATVTFSFYKCLSRVDTGRSVSTRKAHFLDTVYGETRLRACLEVEEQAVCSKRFMGICVRHEKALIGSIRSISEYIWIKCS